MFIGEKTSNICGEMKKKNFLWRSFNLSSERRTDLASKKIIQNLP